MNQVIVHRNGCALRSSTQRFVFLNILQFIDNTRADVPGGAARNQ